LGEPARIETLSPPAGFAQDESSGEKQRWTVKTQFDFSEFEG